MRLDLEQMLVRFLIITLLGKTKLLGMLNDKDASCPTEAKS